MAVITDIWTSHVFGRDIWAHSKSTRQRKAGLWSRMSTSLARGWAGRSFVIPSCFQSQRRRVLIRHIQRLNARLCFWKRTKARNWWRSNRISRFNQTPDGYPALTVGISTGWRRLRRTWATFKWGAVAVMQLLMCCNFHASHDWIFCRVVKINVIHSLFTWNYIFTAPLPLTLSSAHRFRSRQRL